MDVVFMIVIIMKFEEVSVSGSMMLWMVGWLCSSLYVMRLVNVELVRKVRWKDGRY